MNKRDLKERDLVTATLPIGSVDYRSITGSNGFIMSTEENSNPQLAIMGFIQREIEKVGGKALIEAWDEGNEGVNCWWVPPIHFTDPIQGMYIAHMLQAGLLKDSSRILANTAYDGHGAEVADNLISINSRGLNQYVVERDILALALAVPRFVAVWLACALIMFSNGKFEIADKAFQHLLGIDPTNQLGIKYFAISLTDRDPQRAVSLVESLLALLAQQGEAPGAHTRVAYGFALKSAKMVKEAGLQFKIVSGKAIPKMTIKQWIEWGYAINENLLVKALDHPEGEIIIR